MSEGRFKYKVIVKDGMQLVSYNGEQLPALIDTVVEQKLDHATGIKPYCIVTMKVHAEMVDTINDK